MRIRHAGSTVAVAVAVAVGIAACGSSSKTSSSTATAPGGHPTASIATPTPATAPKPTFVAQVNSICARAVPRLNAKGKFPYPNFDPLHPNVKLLPKVGAFIASVQALDARVPEQLARLGNPGNRQAEWQQILVLANSLRTGAGRQIRAARASNARTFVAATREVESIEMRLQKLALEVGLKSSSPCMRLF
jgi:hypothetical protein